MTQPASAWTARLRQRTASGVDALFRGSVDGRVYDVIRVAIAGIFLVRHSDWLRSWLPLEHHRFVHGLMFLDRAPAEPRLESPLALGVSLSSGVNDALVYARTGLALLLLLGVRIRLTASALALTSFVLLAADRYRYYHHLYLLYVAIACLALLPPRSRYSLPALVSGPPEARTQPIWPLQLIRALALSVYLAAGVSKLEPEWFRGEALDHLARLRVLGGPVFEWARGWLGTAGIATAACAVELALPLLLLYERTRIAGVLVAWAFHAGISLSMPVYTFGAQMAVLVLAFWPRAEAEELAVQDDASLAQNPSGGERNVALNAASGP